MSEQGRHSGIGNDCYRVDNDHLPDALAGSLSC